MNCPKTSVPQSPRPVLALGLIVIALCTVALCLAACGAHPSSATSIWAIEVTPNQATATSGSAPGNAVDFSVVAHYSDGHHAPWTGSVQWSVDVGWVNLENGHAICIQPAGPLQCSQPCHHHRPHYHRRKHPHRSCRTNLLLRAEPGLEAGN